MCRFSNSQPNKILHEVLSEMFLLPFFHRQYQTFIGILKLDTQISEKGMTGIPPKEHETWMHVKECLRFVLIDLL